MLHGIDMMYWVVFKDIGKYASAYVYLEPLSISQSPGSAVVASSSHFDGCGHHDGLLRLGVQGARG